VARSNLIPAETSEIFPSLGKSDIAAAHRAALRHLGNTPTRLRRAGRSLALYSFSGVIHGRSKSILSCSATPPVNNAGAMWLSRIFLMAYFGFGSGTNSLPGSRHEHSPNFRPEPQPEHGYASSGDDDNVPFYTVCAPRSFHTGTLA